MSLAMAATTLARFHVLCRAVGARGHGLTLRQIGAAHDLARELDRDVPDSERVEELATRLELDPEALP